MQTFDINNLIEFKLYKLLLSIQIRI